MVNRPAVPGVAQNAHPGSGKPIRMWAGPLHRGFFRQFIQRARRARARFRSDRQGGPAASGFGSAQRSIFRGSASARPLTEVPRHLPVSDDVLLQSLTPRRLTPPWLFLSSTRSHLFAPPTSTSSKLITTIIKLDHQFTTTTPPKITWPPSSATTRAVCSSCNTDSGIWLYPRARADLGHRRSEVAVRRSRETGVGCREVQRFVGILDGLRLGFTHVPMYLLQFHCVATGVRSKTAPLELPRRRLLRGGFPGGLPASTCRAAPLARCAANRRGHLQHPAPAPG